VVRIEDIEINISNHSVTVGGCEVPFTRKEFGTLAYLVRHRGRLITRETLLNEVWGKDINVIDRTVDVHISRIREKLGSSGSLIETMKGVGYRIKTTGRPIG
jgi:DNA-binding response OmpR family regulator